MKIFRGISLLDLDIHRKFSLRGNWSLIHILINHTSNIKTCVGESLHTLLMPIAIQMFLALHQTLGRAYSTKVYVKNLMHYLTALQRFIYALHNPKTNIFAERIKLQVKFYQ